MGCVFEIGNRRGEAALIEKRQSVSKAPASSPKRQGRNRMVSSVKMSEPTWRDFFS